MAVAIEAEGLVKTYGETRALDGLDLAVESGTILGVLGPNGAGKTTAVRVLTTLTRPNAGWARVAGFDVVDAAADVRVTVAAGASLTDAERILTTFAVGPIHVDVETRSLSVPARRDEPGLVTEVVSALAAASVRVDALDVRRPSLDDVFIELTGHAAERAAPADDEEAA